MDNKYLNEGIIGNKNVLATFSKKGELLRIFFPERDGRQYVEKFHVGVKINDSDLIYLHKDVNNVYNQYYEQDTNILNTEIKNTYFNLKIIQTDFVLIKENLLVKKYTFINEGEIDLKPELYFYSKLLTTDNNYVGSKIMDVGLMQYAHDFVFSIFSKEKMIKFQLNNSEETIKRCELWDKDYIGCSSGSAVAFEVGNLKPGEKKEVEVCIYICENKNVSEIEKEIEKVRALDYAEEYKETKQFWEDYLKKHDSIKIKNLDNAYNIKVNEIYKRSILLFPLLTNEKTGGIIAAPEIDEKFKFCGRYAYCWPRDAVFITKAMDILKMTKETEKFYNKFCRLTQSENGMWEQRFFTDGKLAPNWGYQIDETASVIYGIYEHYKFTKSAKFLIENLEMCEKAVGYLKTYVRDIIEKKQKMHVSYDLWEMCESIHLYSLSSIYAAFSCMLKIYEVFEDLKKSIAGSALKTKEKLNFKKFKNEVLDLEELQLKIKIYINDNLYDKNQKVYVRNIDDKKMDISILGIVVPFGICEANDKKMINTVEKINMTLKTYTGGYLRFEGDHYAGGNPWIISNLWMALYYLEVGNLNMAKQCFDFVVKTVGDNNLLSEQVDNKTMQPNWVIGLGWSHAMYIIFLNKLKNIEEFLKII